MLTLALKFEWMSLKRSRAGIAALTAYLAIGALAIGLGSASVRAWQEAVEVASVEQDETIEKARGFFATGAPGPSDRPWIRVAQPMWQDRYAATRLARAPGPLAGIASGSVDPAPVVFHVHRRADPLATGGYRIENPELAAGSVDLVFVLTMLTPLLIGVLGLGVGGREREEGIDRLIVVQAGEVRWWLVCRMAAVTLFASAAAALLCIAASVVGGASVVDALTLLGMALMYTALWGGLVLAVNASARSVRAGAFAFGALWTLLCVLSPTLAAEVGLGRVQTDFAVADTLDVREANYAASDAPLSEALEVLYARYPAAASMPAASAESLGRTVQRHAYDGMRAERLLERHQARLEEDAAARRLAERASWFSPPLALTLGLERVAGVGPEAASAYRDYLVVAVDERIGWVVEGAWSLEDLGEEEFEALLAATPPPYRWTPTRLAGPFLLLGLWLAAAWATALVRVTQSEERAS